MKQGKNSKLNIFRFYGESESEPILENNLTRALAICFLNDDLFLNTFLQKTLGNEYEDLLKTSLFQRTEKDKLDFDLQRHVNDLQQHKTLFAIALTANKHDASEEAIANAYDHGTEDPITDLYMNMGPSFGVIIEVKRSDANCIGQLKNQAEKYKALYPDSDITVKYISQSWEDICDMLMLVNSWRNAQGSQNIWAEHFLELIEMNYTHWLPVQPFSVLPFTNDVHDPKFHQLKKRLIQVASKCTEKSLYNHEGTIAIPIEAHWAREVMLWFNSQNLTLAIYPGNTKGQGNSLFNYNHDLGWVKNKKIEVEGKSYELNVEPHIKFSNSYGSWLFDITLEGKDAEALDIDKYKANFWASGKKSTADYDGVYNWLNSFLPEGWDEEFEDKWDKTFTNSGWTSVNISLGFAMYLNIPFEEVKELDKISSKPEVLAEKIKSMIVAMKATIEGRDIQKALEEATKNQAAQLQSK